MIRNDPTPSTTTPRYIRGWLFDPVGGSVPTLVGATVGAVVGPVVGAVVGPVVVVAGAQPGAMVTVWSCVAVNFG